MCTVSMVGDDWARRFPGQHPWAVPQTPTQPYQLPNAIISGPTRAEFDALKRDVEALRELLMAAKKYDEATGQPDCEVEEKVELIKRVAQLVGVDLGDVFGGKSA